MIRHGENDENEDVESEAVIARINPLHRLKSQHDDCKKDNECPYLAVRIKYSQFAYQHATRINPCRR